MGHSAKEEADPSGDGNQKSSDQGGDAGAFGALRNVTRVTFWVLGWQILD